MNESDAARRFVSFEGLDGAGKTTHLERARAWLEAAGERVVTTREPGGTPLGEAVRSWFLTHQMSPDTEALLVFAARREHLERVIWPALARGAWVLCDRFTDATRAYQGGGRGLPAARIEALAEWVHGRFEPALTFLFDVPRSTAQGRLTGRDGDRIEAESQSFHERVRARYLELAAQAPERVHVIDATADVETVWQSVRARLADHRARLDQR
ncbi:MAG: dTMP kinase [Casimicrobiaceae bacterium]|nr:dTMP kinase [Casimicrobiaceae bacterium]MCX8099123.1 dTMP kinase [Casimicrobiaceae bacterium]MDW8312190.1 dTMP kinase [Burkholderiales bacterium]